MAVDAKTKYLFNSFSCLGKDENMDTFVSLPKYAIFKRGYSVTSDNFFKSLNVALHLADQKCNIVGIV